VRQSRVAGRLSDIDLDRPALRTGDTLKAVGALAARNPSAAGLFKELGTDGIRDLAELEDPIAQRRLIDEWKADRIDSAEIQSALQRADDPGLDQGAVTTFLARSGPEGVRFLDDAPDSRVESVLGRTTRRCGRVGARGASPRTLDCFDRPEPEELSEFVRGIEDLSNDDVYRILGEFDDSTARWLYEAPSSGVSSYQEVGRALRQFDELDTTDQDTFKEILKDPEVRQSWIESAVVFS